VLTGSAEAALERLLTEMPLRRSLMSHTFRSMQRSDQKHLGPITTEELPGYWKDERLPTPLEQADALILWIGDHQPEPSDSVTLNWMKWWTNAFAPLFDERVLSFVGLQFCLPDL
jgi:hypothetical protein